ncbi:alpha/beta hydrolase [Faecalicatena contorta]|uniref:alpha/beta hydrolase n=1 Tax=Faecalicatena contorta TaxID=39482 RepID=UPI001F4691F5|nr:alpha/beta hydrolase [Faecalicatena contorta]MCF2683668.1 alpha/beta hydrolase [Faecalicatena contorta]
MAINKSMRKVLKALSFDGIEVEASRHLANLKAIDPLKIFHKTIDYKIYNGDYEVPVRLYLPDEAVSGKLPVLLFFHGGGWVTESIDNYERICARMAEATNHIVVSVGYRLAPEYPFPTGLNDCYAATKEIYRNHFLLNTDPDKITLIGDSAGGNLAAAVSLMARDRGEFFPQRQILIYPAVNNDYSENSPYESVKTCGSDYLLTAGKMRDYLDFYASDEGDKENKYFAPLLETDYRNQPRTLILTAEYDPLRDEGEEYGKRLKEAGNDVEIHRIPDALHGYFALGISYYHVKESFQIINRFLGED